MKPTKPRKRSDTETINGILSIIVWGICGAGILWSLTTLAFALYNGEPAGVRGIGEGFFVGCLIRIGVLL